MANPRNIVQQNKRRQVGEWQDLADLSL